MRFFVLSFFALVGCGGTSIDLNDGGNGDGGMNPDGSTVDSGNDVSTNPDGSISSCKAPVINLTFANCPPPPTCGGTVADGLYYYTHGCINDPWAQAKQGCPALQVAEEKGTVKGCVTIAGPVVTRDVAATYGAKLTLPPQCTLMAPCPGVETFLKQYFTMASCVSGATPGSCVCTVSSQASEVATTTFTTQNNQIVTSTNNHFDYCVQGNTMGLRWASGPNMESGIYELTKQ
jgi:hypothetical protein